MIKAGFLDEVKTLYKRGDLHAELPAMRAVGYRQAWEHLSGSLTREEMIARAMITSRQLAKRQYTWLRSWSDLHWVYFDVAPDADEVVRAHRLESTVADVEQRVLSFITKD